MHYRVLIKMQEDHSFGVFERSLAEVSVHRDLISIASFGQMSVYGCESAGRHEAEDSKVMD